MLSSAKLSLLLCIGSVLHSHADDCDVGTIDDTCVTGNGDEEFFFCTDRYRWEWSQDVSQLPNQASDSLCITFDSDIVDGLNNTEMLVLGGCDADFQEVTGDCSSISIVTHIYDPQADAFTLGDEMPTARYRAAAVNVSHHVYLFGGRAPNGSLVCTVDRYDAIERVWETLDIVQEDYCYSDHSGIATEDGTVYLFGGYSEDYQSHTTVVKVEIAGDELTFSTSTPMEIKRGDHVCSIMPSSSHVYCMGGFTEENWEYSVLNSVERFDIASETWEERAPMVFPRADFGVGFLHGRITVVGGEDGDGPMDDVEWYDPEDNCWTDSGELFDLPYKRLRYCAATHQADQRIFIFGGQSLPGPTDGTYTISETVNWYKEALVGELTTSGAGTTVTYDGAKLTLIMAFGMAISQLLLPTLIGSW